MIDRMSPYNDIAIPIAWPDQTARGDEKWMAFLKKMGIVKNLNFKVGHAAIVLIRRADGSCHYFDFGRYITPRGYGRARSARFDPRLRLETVARFDQMAALQNLEELLEELTNKSEATHGAGRLLCAVASQISFVHAARYAEQVVDRGPILYGAIAPDNNSCSRYVAQILVHGMKNGDRRIRKIYYPESIKASPTSNVINAIANREVFCYHKNSLEQWSMNRWGSLKFQLGLLKPNFFRRDSASLPDDGILGFMNEPVRPSTLPDDAHWLGGLGEGCWFHLRQDDQGYCITRYNHLGDVDYRVYGAHEHTFNSDLGRPHFSYDVHYERHTLLFGTKMVTFKTQENGPIQFRQSI